MSWKEEIKKQPKPRNRFKSGHAQCKRCKKFFPLARGNLSISGPTTDKEVIENHRSIAQTGMCKECYQKLNRKPQEWPLDDLGYYKRGIDRMRMGRR